MKKKPALVQLRMCWFHFTNRGEGTYRTRTNYMKATAALARRIAEGLWWVMVRNEPYRFWEGQKPETGCEVVQLGKLVVSTETGEILLDQSATPSDLG